MFAKLFHSPETGQVLMSKGYDNKTEQDVLVFMYSLEDIDPDFFIDITMKFDSAEGRNKTFEQLSEEQVLELVGKSQAQVRDAMAEAQ